MFQRGLAATSVFALLFLTMHLGSRESGRRAGAEGTTAIPAARSDRSTANTSDALVTPTFSPDHVAVYQRSEAEITVSFAIPANRTITVASDDTGVATVSLSPAYQGAGANGTTVKVHGVFLGYANLRFTVCTALEGEAGSPQHCATFVYKVAVLRVRTVWNKMFPFLVSVLVAVNFISMGCDLELEVLVAAAKKPLPPALGLACQFLFMPLASYGIGALLLQNPLTRFAVFVMGCCPGGNASNLWTLLFNGDVPLSITMTFLSTLASIGMIPLWLFLLGNRMSPETRRYRIPYAGIVLSLVGIMAPLAVGMALKKKKPDWATRLAKHLKTITIMVLCLLIIFTAVVNYYIFVLLTWRTLACVALISWSAYLFGGLAALVGRLERKQIIAVAIEVAFQNSAIAVIIIYTALPLPDADIMISPVAGQAILKGVPLNLLYSALFVRRRLGALTGATDDTSAAKPLPVPAPAEDARTSGATDSPKAPVSPPSSQPLEQQKAPSQEGLSPDGVAELEEVMSGPPGSVHVLWDTLTAFQGEQLDFAGIARSGPESVQRVPESHGADADREEAASKSTAPAKEAAKLDETAGRPETTKSPPLAVHPPASANGAPC